jgi:O-antigen ligase
MYAKICLKKLVLQDMLDKRLQQMLNNSLCIIAFAIPLPYIFSPLAIILYSFFWLFQFNFRTLLYNFQERKALWLWIIFFLLQAISYFYSIDKQQSLSDLGRKMSFIALPVLIGAGININKDLLKRVFLFFILSINVVAVYCLLRALFVFYTYHTTQQFFYHPLVIGFDANAVYYALYTLISISALLFLPLDSLIPKYLRIVFIVLQMIFFILLSSRTLIILFFIIILPLYLRMSFLQKKRNFLYAALLFSFFILLALIIFKTDNPIKRRYADILNKHIDTIERSQYKSSGNKQYNNLSLRIFLWRVGYDNIKENNLWLFGAGNGSIYTLQNKKMAEYGVMDIYNEKKRSPLYNVNLHNMYLQTLMMIGLVGLLVMLLVVLLPFWRSRHSEFRTFLFIFNFVIVVFMIQESSLQTQAGIVFYTFFSMVTYNYVFSESKKRGNDDNALEISD